MSDNYRAILLGISFYNPNGGGNLSISQVIKLDNESLDKIYQYYIGLTNKTSLFSTPAEGGTQISIIQDLVRFRKELEETEEKKKADRKERALKKEAIQSMLQRKELDSLEKMSPEELQKLLNEL